MTTATEMPTTSEVYLKAQIDNLVIKPATRQSKDAQFWVNNGKNVLGSYGPTPFVTCRKMKGVRLPGGGRAFRTASVNGIPFSIIKCCLAEDANDMHDLLGSTIAKVADVFKNCPMKYQSLFEFANGKEMYEAAFALRNPARFLDIDVHTLEPGEEEDKYVPEYNSPNRRFAKFLCEDEEALFLDLVLDRDTKIYLQDSNGKVIGDYKNKTGTQVYNRDGLIVSDQSAMNSFLHSELFTQKLWSYSFNVLVRMVTVAKGFYKDMNNEWKPVLYPVFKFRPGSQIVMRVDDRSNALETARETAKTTMTKLLFAGTSGPPRKRKQRKLTTASPSKKSKTHGETQDEVEEAIDEGNEAEPEQELEE